MGIAIDSFGNVYVADQVHQRIAKFTNNGIFITDWASQINPTDIAIDSSDNVYVTEMFNSRIAKFASDGTLITKWNTGPISRGIAVDSSDNIWVTSANNGDTNYLVQKFTSGGILLDQWNSAGTDGVNIPTFNGYGIAFDSQGKLFIADTFNNRIQKYETDGNLITQWGNMGTGDGEFDSPHDLAIDFQDNIFVSDTFNHRIQVFAKLIIVKSEISSVAKCNSGDIATGGGFVLGGKATIKSSTPLTTGNGWKATAFVFGTTGGISESFQGSVTANVVCF